MATRRSRAAADTYHHGNLRQALLEHAVELARRGGPDAVVLRDVQRMAAVSNSAAYRHYADRDALLAAVSEYAQSRLADAMVARLNALPRRGPRPRAHWTAACDRPGLYRLCAGRTRLVPDRLLASGLRPQRSFAPGRRRRYRCHSAVAEHHPFQILIRCIDDLVATGVLSPDRRDGFDEAAWAAVHGLSTLFLDGPLSEADSARKQLITDRLLGVIADGLS